MLVKYTPGQDFLAHNRAITLPLNPEQAAYIGYELYELGPISDWTECEEIEWGMFLECMFGRKRVRRYLNGQSNLRFCVKHGGLRRVSELSAERMLGYGRR